MDPAIQTDMLYTIFRSKKEEQEPEHEEQAPWLICQAEVCMYHGNFVPRVVGPRRKVAGSLADAAIN